MFEIIFQFLSLLAFLNVSFFSLFLFPSPKFLIYFFFKFQPYVKDVTTTTDIWEHQLNKFIIEDPEYRNNMSANSD